MFLASSSFFTETSVEMLLDGYSTTPYHYSTPKAGHLPPVKCPASPTPSQTPLLVTCRLVKAHTKLLLLSAYLTTGYRNVRYGYAASNGSLM